MRFELDATHSPTVVNVVTDGSKVSYLKGQERQRESCQKYHCNSMQWVGEYPAGSPTHQEQPYAFKLYALGEAEVLVYGHESRVVIWADSFSWLIQPPAPLVELANKQGVVLWGGGVSLAQFCSDDGLKILELTRDEAEKIELLAGSVFIFDFGHPLAVEVFDELAALYHRGLIKGPCINSQNPEAVKSLYAAGYQGRSEGPCSADPRCYGHRHDEVALGYIAWRRKLPVKRLSDGFGAYLREKSPPQLIIASEGC